MNSKRKIEINIVEVQTYKILIQINSNDVVFWTYFYETDNCEKIPALEDKKYNFTPNFSNDIIVEEIEKLINQIIEKIEKTD